MRSISPVDDDLVCGRRRPVYKVIEVKRGHTLGRVIAETRDHRIATLIGYEAVGGCYDAWTVDPRTLRQLARLSDGCRLVDQVEHYDLMLVGRDGEVLVAELEARERADAGTAIHRVDYSSASPADRAAGHNAPRSRAPGQAMTGPSDAIMRDIKASNAWDQLLSCLSIARDAAVLAIKSGVDKDKALKAGMLAAEIADSLLPEQEDAWTQ